MYEYKSEVVKLSHAFWTGSVKEGELGEVDRVLNDMSIDGWELASSNMTLEPNIASTMILLIFKRKRSI